MTTYATKPLRIIVAEFHQETNSFNPRVWSMRNFEQDICLAGAEIIKKYDGISGSVLNGILYAANKCGVETIPACALHATSGGRVDHDVVDYFLNTLVEAYHVNKPVDGFIMGFHGATQSTHVDDACGYILENLRREVGPDVVISIGCDLHANITEKCVINADYICGFQTYPHVDQHHTGVRAAQLGFRKMLGKGDVHLAQTTLPMILPASGYSTNTSPFKDIMDYGHELVRQGELLDFSLFQMQPWLDVNPAGSSIVTIAEDPEKAKKCASILAEAVYKCRDELWPKLYEIDDVIQLAQKAPQGKPVILVDMADSPGAGALGDSVAVLLHLIQQDYPVRTATIVCDGEAVRHAEQVGAGNSAEFCVGGGLTPGMPGPAKITAHVTSLHEGVFYQEGPVGKGLRRNLGKTAVLSTENIDLLICEHLCGTSDVQVYRSFGIEPTHYQLLVVKANTSFRAAYKSLAYKICLANTPGASSSNLKGLNYTRLPRGFYPFDSLQGFKISEPRIYT